LEPALSACLPKITPADKGFNFNVEVQNFGQVTSQTADIKIVYRKDEREVEVANGQVSKLKPFQKTNVNLTCHTLFDKDVEYDFKVIINTDDIRAVTLHGKITPVK